MTDEFSHAALLAVARQALPRGNGFADVSPEDVVQEAALRLHAVRARLEKDGRKIENPGAWMRTVIVHEAINLARRKMRRLVVPLDAGAADDRGAVSVEPAASDATPEELMIEQQQRHRVRDAIKALPPTQRTVMELEIAGFDTAEIAERLHLDARAIRTRRCRALKELKHVLAPAAAQS